LVGFGKFNINHVFLAKINEMLNRLLSYIFPVTISRQESAISKTLEVTWTDGRLVLDSKHTNYSYGSLQRILRRGLLKIGAEKILQMQHILVLGVAGGSVIRTLSDEIGFRRKITGVEIDPAIIDIANKHFGLSEIHGLEIVIADAAQYAKSETRQFDLVIIDVFHDQDMPDFLFSEEFSKNVLRMLHVGGYVLFNTMALQQWQEERNINYVAILKEQGCEIETISRIERFNELIIARKLY
jgi:spermidine synthase